MKELLLAVALAIVASAGCGRYEFETAPDAASTLLEMPACIRVACDGLSLQLCPTLATWQGGLAACAAAAGTLARVETASHALCVGTAMAAAGIDYAWIGLVQTPGQPAPDVGWTWTSSPSPTVFWAPGEPTDLDSIENDEHDCGRVQAPNGIAADRTCGDSYAYLCAPP